ncbi:RNA-binding protein S4 [Vitreoscilla filiformis]|jgi:ribosome-associated protein|uniref:RNA-binding protein S4 n=1 Tax=Vitreoscilla filiformis TaxID=63 RepID=A0A221KFW2_VITFI|nr:RNA-binding S4 domain-containing protein [Vitreoscilla filiformis]ASM77700.1 RNA-binding protein S4 [Vitreoscilla filiformis]
MQQNVTFELRTDHITLDALLKATALAFSGGAAKQMILGGQVQVDGLVEQRRGRKVRANHVVRVHTPDSVHVIHVQAPAENGP